MKKEAANKIILASQSPRRKQLLEQLGLKINIAPADLDETVVSTMVPGPHVEELARLKAEHTSGSFPDSWVLGADTVVVVEGKILGKPASRSDAVSMLELLSGKTHEVYTGFCLICSQANKMVTRSVKTIVEFKKLTWDEIDWYVQTGEPFDKAGGYGIQGIGAFLVRGINGSYSNVVGLPVCEVFETLIELRIIQFRN